MTDDLVPTCGEAVPCLWASFREGRDTAFG